MPTYEYRCENDHHFEEFQSMVSPPIEVCPICGGKAERLISGGSGLIFKGSGFYITDYAKKGGGSSAHSRNSSATTKVSDKPAADSSPASETKTESKTD
jgi:putative FmdB family regulatory protein